MVIVSLRLSALEAIDFFFNVLIYFEGERASIVREGQRERGGQR